MYIGPCSRHTTFVYTAFLALVFPPSSFLLILHGVWVRYRSERVFVKAQHHASLWFFLFLSFSHSYLLHSSIPRLSPFPIQIGMIGSFTVCLYDSLHTIHPNGRKRSNIARRVYCATQTLISPPPFEDGHSTHQPSTFSLSGWKPHRKAVIMHSTWLQIQLLATRIRKKKFSQRFTCEWSLSAHPRSSLSDCDYFPCCI